MTRKMNEIVYFVDNSLQAERERLVKFFKKCFNPNHVKVSMLILAGRSDMGKSWISSMINNICQAMNGVVQGSELDNNFVRVSNLALRNLRIIEEYKGNILEDFHHLEANSKQLMKNNAVLNNRVSLVILNSDRSNFSLETLREELRDKKSTVKSRLFTPRFTNRWIAKTESLRQQVQNRSCILRLNSEAFVNFK